MAGTYTDIVQIVSPDEAAAGSEVSVEVRIKNTWTGAVHILCAAVLDDELRFIDWLDFWVAPGETRSFAGRFIMPQRNVRINAYSYFEGADGLVYADDRRAKDVSLSALTPAFSELMIADYRKA